MKEIQFTNLLDESVFIKNEINDVLENIIFKKSEFILGEELMNFEFNFAKFITSNYCIGVANGTDAIEIAINSLNLNDDDEIITQANTYVATCFGVTNNNRKLKLVDIDEDTYQMNLLELERNITNKTKVVIIVHLTGSCCNMDELMIIINKYNLILIEDCSQSHGAYYKNKRLGSYGLFSTFSFYPSKNLGAFGDGGAICTNDKELDTKLRKIRNNGSIEKYVHEIYGRNSRLDNIQAGILNIKLKYLDVNNNKRCIKAELYKKLLKNVTEIKLPSIVDGCIPVYHLFMIKAYKRDELKKYLQEHNVQVGIHYPICIPNLECYKDYFTDDYKNAINNSTSILSLPMYPNIEDEDINTVCSLIKQFYIMDFPF
jgi:dTDP-4-amino-4,6-dideoxygalactose transaminase